MGDTLKALNLQAHCRKLYLQSGMRKEAALSYPRLIYTLLNRANYKRLLIICLSLNRSQGCLTVIII